MEGWISLYRKVLDNPLVCKDSDYFAIWIYLLLNATRKEQPKMFDGKKIILHKGQLITSRKSIAEKFKNISESKVTRVLNKLKIEHQIEQQTCTTNRLITILNWEQYQNSEQQIEQRVNNERTTSEQRVNTNNKEIKKQCNKKIFIIPTIEEIKLYCEERKNNVNPNKFYDFYQSNGWKVGKNKMKDWKASVRTWEQNSTNNKTLATSKKKPFQDYEQRKYDDLDNYIDIGGK